ncbi:MAG: SUMF1/EgtB/PvdO family nonheme iron enzyme [Terracidiphilus sp.]
MTTTKSLVFKFGDVEVREREFSLVKAGEAAAIEPKAFRVLLYLLRNPQRVVTKKELMDAVWGDAAVTESSLTRAVAKLRKLLEDDFLEPQYIATVATVGYRFVCDVEMSEDLRSTIAEVSAPAEDGRNPSCSTVTILSEIIRPSDLTAGAPIAQIPSRTEAKASMGQTKRLRATVGVLIILLGFGILWAWLLHQRSRARWAREKAIPEIERLVDAGEFVKAATLTQDAKTVLPADPTLDKLWERATGEISIASSPSGAEVSIRPYRSDPNAWETIGRTPLKNFRVPRDVYVWRIGAPGFDPMFFIDEPPGPADPGLKWYLDRSLTLRRTERIPPEMVVVSGGEIGLPSPSQTAPFVGVGDFLIDRHEVTNDQYKRFVDAGGYQRPEFWKQPFVRKGKQIPWEKAVAEFRDGTGRPGPAIWEAGSYPSGMERHPVAGVSWYEAMAYAAFAGKSLPTVYHWTLASQSQDFTSLIASGSNFKGERTQAVGNSRALSGFGTTDMAGNVKEWCVNEGRNGRHYILGGGFGEPAYTFATTDEQSPWDRRPNFGFRCIKLDAPASDRAAAKIVVNARDFSKEKPAAPNVFKAYTALYVYDRRALNSRIEETRTTPDWTREKVSFDAAYGHERVIAYLFLPRAESHPLQTVVYFPGAISLFDENFEASGVESSDCLEFLLKSGRAVMFPIYKGTYERRDGLVPGGKPPAFFRDHVIEWSKDMGRSLDYLETRKDIDSSKIAYFGSSMGGVEGTVMAAIEPRIKVMILSSGGFHFRHDLPEVDSFNFAPHVTIPVLMLTGRYDELFPLESSQLPLFRLLGTPAKDKKQVVFDGGHGVFPHPGAVRESLNWLDKYLGAVQR